MVCGDLKGLVRLSDKILRDKALAKNFLKIQNMMNIKEILFLWFIIFLIKKPLVVALKIKLNHLLKVFKNEDYIHHSDTICGVLN